MRINEVNVKVMKIKILTLIENAVLLRNTSFNFGICMVNLPKNDLILFLDFEFLKYILFFKISQGTIPRGNFTDENVKSLGLKAGDVVVRCTRCECIKVDRAHHCSTCQRCIKKMDHHCPW